MCERSVNLDFFPAGSIEIYKDLWYVLFDEILLLLCYKLLL